MFDPTCNLITNELFYSEIVRNVLLMNNRGQFQEEIHNNSNILPIVNSLVGGNNMLMFDSQQYIDFPQN